MYVLEIIKGYENLSLGTRKYLIKALSAKGDKAKYYPRTINSVLEELASGKYKFSIVRKVLNCIPQSSSRYYVLFNSNRCLRFVDYELERLVNRFYYNRFVYNNLDRALKYYGAMCKYSGNKYSEPLRQDIVEIIKKFYL